MKKLLPIMLCCIALLGACGTRKASETTLKSVLADKFYIGTALNSWQVAGRDSNATDIVTRHFNAIVAENCMKSESLQPREGEFRFRQADEFVAFGERHGMHIPGHCLI